MSAIRRQRRRFEDQAVTLKHNRRPDWLKVKIPTGENYTFLKDLVKRKKLNTVCEDARCPNMAECWHRKTATFMILGEVCTRSCGFCSVKLGHPEALDYDEPRRVAESVRDLGLKHAVITSVNRDDQKLGGADIFAMTIKKIKELVPDCRVEVLIPDFRGVWEALDAVLDAKPDILNHNIETVKRLYHFVRPQADYYRTLEMLKRAKEKGFTTKSGFMELKGNFYNPHLRHQDEPITLSGQRRSQKLWSFFSKRNISAIYVSEYLRAAQTIEYVAGILGISPVTDKRLNEIDNGVIEGMSDDEIRTTYPEVWNGFRERNHDFRFPNGETGEEAQKRIAEFLEEKRSLHSSENIILTCHEGLIRLMACHVMGLPVYARWNFSVDFCGIMEITYQPEYNNWKLIRFNQLVEWKQHIPVSATLYSGAIL